MVRTGVCMRRRRADQSGIDEGIFRKNRAILIKTAEFCALCGRPIDKTLKAPDPFSVSIDHIIPVAKGGKSTMDNLQATHLICNKQKGAKIILQRHSNETKVVQFKSFPQYVDWQTYQG